MSTRGYFSCSWKPSPPLLATRYYGYLPGTILRHIAHGTYMIRLPGGTVVTDVPDLTAGTF